MSNYTTIKQHEPLRTPKNWGEQEKRFIAQLEEVLDDLYSRFGRLKEKDLGQSLRKSIAESSEGVSELKQTAKDFTATFRDIGAAGEPTGVTKIGADGLTVTHTNIGGKTMLNADGMRMFGADGKLVGGLFKLGERIVSAVECLMNPQQTNFRVSVAPDDYEGEQSGLHFIINDVDAGAISASSNEGGSAMRMDAAGQMILSGKNLFISCKEGKMTVSSASDIEFIFYGKNLAGQDAQLTLSMQDIYNVVAPNID